MCLKLTLICNTLSLRQLMSHIRELAFRALVQVPDAPFLMQLPTNGFQGGSKIQPNYLDPFLLQWEK